MVVLTTLVAGDIIKDGTLPVDESEIFVSTGGSTTAFFASGFDMLGSMGLACRLPLPFFLLLPPLLFFPAGAFFLFP